MIQKTKNSGFIQHLFSSEKKIGAGFTLLELMVVVAIIGIITTVSLFNYNKFNNNLSVTNLAYEIALSVREAQVFGGSVRVSAAGSQNFDNAYGVHFSTETAFKSERFVSFVDSAPSSVSPLPPGDGRYGGDFVTCVGECTSIQRLSRGVRVTSICRDAYIISCPNGRKENAVDVTFLRPNLDARIRFPGDGSQSDSQSEVYITITAPDGNEKVIKVQRNGQIAVLD